ncbi:RNA-directed DNA polymerase, eukaryota [Tanacetum coccineum]
MTSISHMDVKFLWGNSNYDYVCSESLGNSGGILCIWEASIFKKINTTVSDNFIAIYGTWLPTNSKILFIAIYAPQQTSCKRKLWDYISNIVGRWNGESIIMGDFNEVRSSEERRGSCFNPYSARYFDRFISNAGLVDVTLEGYAFTWAHPSASKMSKLDRFLVSDGIFSLFPSITAICLDRHLSDHRPILLREVKLDFGPTPFRFYHSWFDYVGFDDMIKLSWHSFSHSDTSGMIRFKKKLQDLKKIIRSWIKAKKLPSSRKPAFVCITVDMSRKSDLEGNDLMLQRLEMEVKYDSTFLFLIEIYNSVDACTSAKDMWKRVERLMRGTIQNKVDRETRFMNKFDQFVAEPGEALVSVYNRFAQLMNDLERNNMNFPTVTINTKFLNSLQPEWLKYQFEKLVNASRAKKLEKSHDPLALVANTGSSSRQTSSYYVTHPTSVVDYDDEYQQDDVHNNSEDPLVSAMLLLAKAITQNFSNPTNNRLRASSNTRNQAIIQGDRVNIQSRNSGNTGRNNRRAYVQEEVVEGMNAPNETGNVQRTLRTPSSGNTSTVQCYNCSGKGHYARNCPKPRVRDSKYFMEQMLLAK